MSATQPPVNLAELLATAPVIDGHNDLPWELRVRAGYDLDRLDLATDLRPAGLCTDLPRLRAGGVGAQFWSVYVPCSLTGGDAVTATLEQIDAVYAMAQRYPDDLVVATTADEIEQARRDGRIASLLGAEGGHAIDCSLGTLRCLYALGVRYLTLTHQRNTPWADSATDAPAVGGLSAFGREVVRECNRLGMLVDLAHVAASTMHAALDVSAAPAFFSHSSASAVCDTTRNVPDDVLARVRDTGGVVMVTFVPGFLNEECRQWFATSPPIGPRPPCGIGDVADHIEHIRAVAGVDHIGLGGDFDGTTEFPDGLDGVDRYPALLAELADRGWCAADLAKLTWHNTLRVLRATEQVAVDLRGRRGPSLARFVDLDGPSGIMAG